MLKPHLLPVLTLAATLLCSSQGAWATTYSAAVLADNPVAYYRFEDANANNGSTAANSATTGSALDGTYNGAGLSLVANSYHSNLGNAVNVTSNSYVEALDNAALDLTTAATLEAWVSAPSAGANANEWARLISKERTTAYHLAFRHDTGKVFAENGGHLLIDDEDIRGDGWTHVAATFDNTVGWKIYINGVESVSDTDTTTLGTNNQVLRLFRDSTGGDYYTGLADEIAIYSTALSAARIQAHYNAAVPEPSSFVLAGLGLIGLAGWGVRRRRAQ